jgi:C-terminal processing protease CtpA/Prc
VETTIVSTDLVEGHIVITNSDDKALQPGDVIATIDGKRAEGLLNEEETRISGSPQWRRVRGLRRLGRGAPGSHATVTVERGDLRFIATVARVTRPVVAESLHAAIERFDDGVYYVDLARATMQDLDGSRSSAAAPGIVFDVRQRPNSNIRFFHLLTRPDRADAWMTVPRIRPDGASSPAAWRASGWNLPVLSPHIQGRVAFLTGPAAISYAESVMGLVEYYRLGEIVGGSTAGTNGDVAQTLTPSGCEVSFTGRRVTKLDGSRHYLNGIQPTIPASSTIAGLRARRDEVLEAALAYVRREQHN